MDRSGTNSWAVGQDPSPTAGSFVRASRPANAPLSFFDALKHKYTSSDVDPQKRDPQAIQISGKTVEEVGFEKIQQKLAALSELRVVILDGLCIAGLNASPWISSAGLPPPQPPQPSYDLRIEELDLSNNLLESWADVVFICTSLKSLRSLTLR